MSIKHAVIPPFIRSITHLAFYRYVKLKTVDFIGKSELEHIEEFAFSCTSVSSVELPKHVAFAKAKSFSRCRFLERVVVADYSELRSMKKYEFGSSMMKIVALPPRALQIDASCNCCKKGKSEKK